MCVIVICISILFSFEPYLRPLEIEEGKSKYTCIEVMLSSSETVYCCYTYCIIFVTVIVHELLICAFMHIMVISYWKTHSILFHYQDVFIS